MKLDTLKWWVQRAKSYHIYFMRSITHLRLFSHALFVLSISLNMEGLFYRCCGHWIYNRGAICVQNFWWVPATDCHQRATLSPCKSGCTKNHALLDHNLCWKRLETKPGRLQAHCEDVQQCGSQDLWRNRPHVDERTIEYPKLDILLMARRWFSWFPWRLV